MKQKYWFKGGILYTLVGIVCVAFAISFFMFEPWHWFQQTHTTSVIFDWLGWLALGTFGLFGGAWPLVAMGLGMRGTPAETPEIVFAILFAVVYQLISSFAIGAFWGWIYGLFAVRNKRKYFFIGITLLITFGIVSSLYTGQDTYKVYRSMDTPSECHDFFKKFINDFDVNDCVRAVALNHEQATMCDATEPAYANVYHKDPEDMKWFCYEEVAHVKKDPAICALISSNNYRRNGCFEYLGACELITDIQYKERCIRNTAQI